jgi:ankyrin repeat protein
LRLALIVLSVLVLLWPTPILANMGLPMVALYLPPAWFALLPIILIESAYGVWRFKVPMGRAFVAQAVANSVSTLIGIPATWVILALIEMFVLKWAAGVVPEPLLVVVVPIVGAAWLGPGAEQTWWMVPLAVALLTVPLYVMSVASEYLVVVQFFRRLPRQMIRRWTIRANAISYAFLVALVLIGWLLPRASLPLFELMRPLNEQLVGVVFRVANQGSASRSGETALMQAVQAGDLPTTRKLIAKGENVNSADKDGNTPLQVAASRGDEKMTRLLLDAGADINARSKGPIDRTALHDAAYTGNGPTVQVLLSAGARVNDVADGGWTPLMIAMLYGRPDVVEALLAGGADVNVRSPSGWTALKEARMRGHAEIAERLLRAGAIDYPDGSRS